MVQWVIHNWYSILMLVSHVPWTTRYSIKCKAGHPIMFYTCSPRFDFWCFHLIVESPKHWSPLEVSQMCIWAAVKVAAARTPPAPQAQAPSTLQASVDRGLHTTMLNVSLHAQIKRSRILDYQNSIELAVQFFVHNIYAHFKNTAVIEIACSHPNWYQSSLAIPFYVLG